MTDPLDRAMPHARAWLDGLDAAPVGGRATADALRDALGGPLPETGSDAGGIIDALAEGALPGLHANAGGRFFAWVMAGALPSAVAADWLVSAWDQNVYRRAIDDDYRGNHRRVAEGPVRLAAGMLVRVHDRLPARACHVTGRRPACRAGAGGLGCRA